jgi:hypothetical protein
MISYYVFVTVDENDLLGLFCMSRIKKNCVGVSTIRCMYYKYYKSVKLLSRYTLYHIHITKCVDCILLMGIL